MCHSCYSYFIYTVHEFCAVLLPCIVLAFVASSSPRLKAFCLVLEETALYTFLFLTLAIIEIFLEPLWA